MSIYYLLLILIIYLIIYPGASTNLYFNCIYLIIRSVLNINNLYIQEYILMHHFVSIVFLFILYNRLRNACIMLLSPNKVYY